MITERNLDTAKKVIENLQKANWDFQNETSNGDISSLHPFPARFIPSIPRTILNAFDAEKSQLKVLDPFAGCGTTLTEAQRRGAKAVGIDINGLANFLQTAYTADYNDKDLEIFDSLADKVLKNVQSKKGYDDTVNIPNINHWFDNDAIAITKRSISVVNNEQNSKIAKIFGLLSISRVLVALSRQKSDTQYVAVDKFLSYEQKVDILTNSFKTVRDHFEQFKSKERTEALCIHGDSREEEAYSSFDGVNLVITSPPYPNAYEYWLYHKYRMYWLGMDPIYTRANEIGVRPHYSGTGKKNEWDFYQDIKSVLSNIDKVTTKEALQFWVVGDSIIKGKRIDNAEIISNAARDIGWSNIATFKRNINRKRSSFQGIGNKELENIVVLSR